jgi:phosphocarrier protein
MHRPIPGEQQTDHNELRCRHRPGREARGTDSAELVDGKSVMQMLMLACTHGTEIEIHCEGADEQAALDALVRLVESRFEEE